MAESDYFWTSQIVQERFYENYPGPYSSGYERFDNPARLWAGITRDEARQFIIDHPLLPLGAQDYGSLSAPGYSRDSYGTPTFFASVSLNDGTFVQDGYADFNITVELYVMEVLVTRPDYVGQQTQYVIIMGIPKTYDEDAVTTPPFPTVDPFPDYPLFPVIYNNIFFHPSTEVSGTDYGVYLWGPAPKPTVGDVDLQIGRNGLGTYYAQPGHESVLPKYYNPVKRIRAQFDTTRIAIIEDSLEGGFIVYEEVGGNPSGNVFVYDGQRKLKTIVDAAFISQYKASVT